MVDVFVPEIEFNQNRQNTYFDATKVGTLDVLGATLEETFYYNPTNAVDRFLQMQFGEGRTGNILSPEQYKTSEYFREGLEAPEEGIKEGYAQLLAQNYDKRAAITQTLSRSKGGFGLGAAQFGTMLLGSVLDPINVASAFIPVFPAARYAHLVKNLGLTKARAVRGVVEGSVGATLVEPIVLGQAALEQDENYNLLDSFLNVTIGGVLGGGLHVGFGKLSDTIERRSQKTKEQAVLTAVKQTLTDQEVNVTPIIKADLEKTFEKNLEKQNNLAQEKPTRIEDVTRTGKGLPGSLKATKPKTLVQFMKENGGIRPDDPQVSDLRASLDKATFTVLNKKDGLSLDEMTIRVQEAGYFLDKSDLDYGIDGATPRDLLDLIDRESRGEVLYSRDQETQFRDYDRSQKNLEELDRLGVDPRNMTEEELSQALEIAIEQDILAQDVRLSESMEQTSDLTAQEFDNAKIEAVENDYNMGNFKQEYNDMVEMNAGIDDTFNLQTREAEIDTEIETLEFDAENTSNAANIDADDLAAFDANIKAADDLIAKADESYNTATDAAASCIMRNTK
tara:strand:+ start:3052 stop:4743 length:1692 start_codon:yes stop_codon:yes gene_type:complete